MMSRPIAIPAERPSHIPQRPSRSLAKRRAPDCGSGPFFGLVEVLESGSGKWLLSAGNSRYISVKPYHQLPALAFAVERDLSCKRISIRIISDELKKVLMQCLRKRSAPSINPKLDLDTLLRSYDTVKSKLQRAKATTPQHGVLKELDLLLNGFLLDRSVYEGIGLADFKARGLLSMTYLQDLHQRATNHGLRDIHDCLALGSVSDDEAFDNLEGIKAKIAHFIQTGDLNSLQALCEPIITSGEVDIPYNQGILLKALDMSHYDVYEYMLDVMDRSGNAPIRDLGSNLSDVTYDPMYNAIRLGHLSTVENLIAEVAFFEGYVTGEGVPEGHVITPLCAAVFWHQTEIVQRLINSVLKAGLLYYAGYNQAVEWARTPEMKDMLRRIPDKDQLYDIRGPLLSLTLNTPDASSHCPAAGMEPPPFLGYLENSQVVGSVSALSDGLANASIAPSHLNYGFCPSLSVDGCGESYGWQQEERTSNMPQPYPFKSQSPLAPRQAPPFAPHLVNPIDRSSEEFALYAATHLRRRGMGRSILQRLGTQRLKVLRAVSGKGTVDITSFLGTDTLWKRGLRSWESLLRNTPVSGVTQVLQCLLVVDAISYHMASEDQRLPLQCLVDASAWRNVVSFSEWSLFDGIISAIWGGVDCKNQHIACEQDNGYMQHLIQCIVGAGHLHYRPDAVLTPGRRLSGFEPLNWKSSRCQVEIMSDCNFGHIDSELRRLSIDEDAPQPDLFDLKDFIDVDKLQEDILCERSRSYRAFTQGLPPAAERDIHPAVIECLSSAAFSWVLAMISVLQGRPEDKILDALATSCHHGSPMEFMEAFLTIDDSTKTLSLPHAQPYTSGAPGSHLPRLIASSSLKPSKDKASSTAVLLSGSLSDSTSTVCTLRGASLSDPSSSFFSSSPETSRRWACQFPRCDKTFSSVSNRNKHMKEGCTFRDKKGYKCRNPGCDKLVTTKWYRNTHEQERCRYRLT